MIIGILLRHIKAYKGMNFIPIGHEHNFVAYAGENGVGKSSILEAINIFINNKTWLINKSAKPNIKQENNSPLICPVFFIEKDKISRLKKEFELVSNFFWNIEKKDSKNGFFLLRDSLLEKGYTSQTHFLIHLGENINKELYIPLGDKAAEKLKILFQDEIGADLMKSKLLKELKDLYSYVYMPVEMDLESFTKIETDEMQKVFDKKIIDEIKSILPRDFTTEINKKLNLFVEDIEKNLNNNYFYDTGDTGDKFLTPTSIIEKILETYFQKRVLIKGSRSDKKIGKKISELSAGEKRQALIDLITAFLKEEKDRDKFVIIGIDEPENSLHTSLCFEQFNKLKQISKNCQVLITTHWYGFLPIIDKGLVHFIKKANQIEFYEKTNLFNYQYKIKKLPEGFNLKSTNDLVQSIYHSLKGENKTNWIICEGISDKIYLEYFFNEMINNNTLHVIAVGSVETVKKFYKYLCLPLSENTNTNIGKVFCLTDTDIKHKQDDISIETSIQKILVLKRLFNTDDFKSTNLINFTDTRVNKTTIERALNPIIFDETIKELLGHESYTFNIQDIKGNTDSKNMRCFEYLDYVEENKVDFAKCYISKHDEIGIDTDVPIWINEINNFFEI